MVRPPAANRGGLGSDSELDGFEVGGAVCDVGVCLIVGDGLQNLQQLGASGSAVQEGGCEVQGHGRIVG